MPLIWVNREAEYFFRHDWTGQISLNQLAKFDFTRTGFGPEKRTAQPHDEPSYPAHAGYPVRRGLSIPLLMSRSTGSPAGACHRGRRRRDPVAGDDSRGHGAWVLNTPPRIQSSKQKRLHGNRQLAVRRLLHLEIHLFLRGRIANPDAQQSGADSHPRAS